MTKRLFQVLFLAVTLFATVQVSAQSFPSVAPAPGTTTYSSMPALPADFNYINGIYLYSWSYNPDGSVKETLLYNGIFTIITNYIAGQTISVGGVGGISYTVSAAPTLPAGYSYTPTGQILTPSGTTVSSFDFNNATVPFDGGMSLVLLASGIGYASKRMKAKKAIAATV